MSAQFDFLAGLDLTSLSSVTQAQLMQAINQLAPLANIGGVIYGSTTPDVASNPRFSRYLWIDSSTIGVSTQATPKYYNTSTATWNSVTVPAASIGSTQLAAHVDALTHMFTAATPDAALIDQVLVYDSSGQYITSVSRATLLASLSIAVTQIPTGGSSLGQVLSNVAGVTAWASINLSTFPLLGTLPLANLTPGTNDYLLVTRAGVPVWVSSNDSASLWLPAGSSTGGIDISKLKQNGIPLRYPRTNAANNAMEWAYVPVLQTLVTQVTGSGVSGNTAIPIDNTLPQYNEGVSTTLIKNITPKTATSTLHIEVTLHASHNNAASVQLVASLFVGTAAAFEAGTPDAIAVAMTQIGQNNVVPIVFRHSLTSASTTERYYGVRFGTAAGNTVRLNFDGTNTMGDGIVSSIKITEVQN